MEARPKIKIKLTWFNDTTTRQRVSKDGLGYVLSWVGAHDCEVFDLELDAEFPELFIKIWPNSNVMLDTRPTRYGITNEKPE